MDGEFESGVTPASSFSESGQDARAPFEDALLTRLVALNHERAAEEKRGLIRWLRPEYQNPNAATSDGEVRIAMTNYGQLLNAYPPSPASPSVSAADSPSV